MTNKYTFNKGCLLSKNWIVLTATNAESNDIHHYLLYCINGEWSHEYYPGTNFQQILATKNPVNSLITLTGNGTARISNKEGVENEFIDSTSEGPSDTQWLLGLNEIAAQLYVCGMGRKVYKRLKANNWKNIANQIASDDVVGLKAMGGFSEREIYLAGMHGEIWQYLDGKYSEVNSPTNVLLENVVCTKKGVAYISGSRGIVLEGRYDKWNLISNEVTSKTIWSSVEFQNEIFFLTSSGLFRLEKNELVGIDIPVGPTPTQLNHLSVCETHMLVTGTNMLYIFDGKNWEKISGI